ncbi:hypothetical protein AMATHDRAFT_74163 [Amanita thiersii Skay4041]|uniref:Transcriptional regulatory protein n=1 Tax=Amanita thiersii Skay4041 TaxID=703135 RepID=A0A2A9NN16_9AGAR|nr:hypothetical protein AMATHDRAFT_74163 [Amanita thiersii Skay4041]
MSNALFFTLRRTLTTYPPKLAGHNKWSKIKQKKGIIDAQKGAIYGRIRRDIILAVRNGGSAEPALNLQLAAALKRAKEQDVPKDNIEKALAKATGGRDKVGDSLTYEALAFNSVGVIIECLTNNTNRTHHNIREILTTHGARFAPVMFMFQRRGYVRVAVEISRTDTDDPTEKLIELALESGAEDFEQQESDEGSLEAEFTCQSNALARVTAALTTSPLCRELLASELIYKPTERCPAADEVESRLSPLVDELEGNEDTLRVWTTLDS